MTDDRPLALVTGGSSGIGYELVAQFAQHGFDVAISGQSERVFASADRLRELGGQAYPHQADAATYDGVESFWQFVADLGRPLEAAALNVGIGQGRAFADNDLAENFRLIAVNITGTVHMAKRVVQHMVRNGRGRIWSCRRRPRRRSRPSTARRRHSGSPSPRACGRSCVAAASRSPHCFLVRQTATSTATPAWVRTLVSALSQRTTRRWSHRRASRR